MAKSLKKKPAKRSAKRGVKNEKHPTATYPRAKLKLPKGVDPQRKRAASKKNPSAVGKGQQALLRLAQRADGQWVMLTNVTHRQVPLGFAQIMRSAEALAGKGLVEYASLGPGVGYAIRAVASRNPDAAVAPSGAAPVASTLAPPAPAPVAAVVPTPAAPAAVPATKNPSSRRTFSWRGIDYVVALNYDMAVYHRGNSGWMSVRAALKDKSLEPELRAHLKAAVHALQQARKVRAKTLAKTVKTAAKKVKRVTGKRNGAVEKAAAASLKAEKHERALAKKRAGTKGRKNAGKSRAKNPTTAAKPKRQPTKKDFARIVTLFKKYRALFASKVHVDMMGAKLLVDPAIHDSARHFAMTTGKPGVDPVVTIAPELAFEPVTVQTGIIAHELGHAAVMSGFVAQVKGDYDAIERQADKLAEKIAGLKIYYDSRGVEVAGKGAKGRRPRPAGLR